GRVRLWNTATWRPVGAPVQATSPFNGVRGVAFSRDGTLLASADGDGTVRLWNTATARPVGAPLQIGSSGVSAVAFSPGGKLAIGGAHTGRLGEPGTRQPPGQTPPTRSRPARGACPRGF